MELIIKFNGREIGFFFEGADAKTAVLGLPEYTVRKLRESSGPYLNVVAAKVGTVLKGHVWPQKTAVWVEHRNERLLACAA